MQAFIMLTNFRIYSFSFRALLSEAYKFCITPKRDGDLENVVIEMEDMAPEAYRYDSSLY